MGLTSFDATETLTAALEPFGFDLRVPYTTDELYKYALNDKKIKGDHIAMVIPEKPGRCVLQKISLDDLHRFIELGNEA